MKKVVVSLLLLLFLLVCLMLNTLSDFPSSNFCCYNERSNLFVIYTNATIISVSSLFEITIYIWKYLYCNCANLEVFIFEQITAECARAQDGNVTKATGASVDTYSSYFFWDFSGDFIPLFSNYCIPNIYFG